MTIEEIKGLLNNAVKEPDRAVDSLLQVSKELDTLAANQKEMETQLTQSQQRIQTMQQERVDLFMRYGGVPGASDDQAVADEAPAYTPDDYVKEVYNVDTNDPRFGAAASAMDTTVPHMGG